MKFYHILSACAYLCRSLMRHCFKLQKSCAVKTDASIGNVNMKLFVVAITITVCLQCV